MKICPYLFGYPANRQTDSFENRTQKSKVAFVLVEKVMAFRWNFADQWCMLVARGHRLRTFNKWKQRWCKTTWRPQDICLGEINIVTVL